MDDKFDISKWKRKLITENSTEIPKEKDSFAQAEDNLFKKVTGEEPKASTKNKFRGVKEGVLKNDDVIYNYLTEIIDQEELVSQMMNAAEENPKLTLKDYLESFSEKDEE
jgi:hypothetical protein